MSGNQLLRRVRGGLVSEHADPQSRRCIPHPETACHASLFTPPDVPEDNYKTILDKADRHFESVVRTQPENLQCGRGCSLCCYGLFEIGSGDVPIIAEGLERMHPARRKKVIRRARQIVESTSHPDLRNCSPEEKELFFDRTQSTPCPNLDENGACVMYEHRPLVCRTFGLPLRDGPTYIGDICELNFKESTEQQRNAAAWDLELEDVLGQEDEFTIPEVIVMVSRLRKY